MIEEQLEGQMSLFDQDIWCGRTSQEHSHQTEEKISEPYSKKRQESKIKMPLFLDLRKENGHLPDVSWEMDGQSLGEYTTHSFGEYPNEERESLLSQILEERPHPKYSLSAKACQGILRRAEKRGKVLPEMLDRALRQQAGLSVSKNEQENLGGGKGILIQDEHVGALQTSNNQNVCCGVDAYNHSVSGDVAVTLNATSGTSGGQSGPSVMVYGICSDGSNAMRSDNPRSGIYEADTTRTLDNNGGNPACNQGGMIVLEGNGARPSHKGNGYVESDVSYTLNATEQHGVCYRKQGHPQNAQQGQSWEETEINDTLNAFDQGEARTPTVIIENHPQDSRVKIRDDGICQTLDARMGMCGGNVPMVMEPTVASKASYFMKTHDDGKAETLVATDYKDPQLIAYGLDRAAYNQGMNAQYDFSVEEEKIGTQVAKGPGAVCQSVVRRLTPLECERLQGYPIVRKVRFTEMTKDEYIAWNINEGHIVVDTEYGKVFATRGPGGIKLDEPRELTGSIVNGYKVVSIRNGETKMQCRIHRIVWIAEHGVIPDGYVVDHINNDKQDNRRCNLQLLTPAENSTKARKEGLYKIHEESGSAKITDEVHDFIQYVYGNSDLSIRQLSEIFGISKSRVQQIIHDEPWTDIGDWIDSKGKKRKGESDSPRYKALGNSIALPFWQWMAERMVAQYDRPTTMASLFDGIGGFPLVYSRCGCTPVWASEIEEFPIAVTKIRFQEV